MMLKLGQLVNIFTHLTLANYEYLPIKFVLQTYVTIKMQSFVICSTLKVQLCTVCSAPYGLPEEFRHLSAHCS